MYNLSYLLRSKSDLVWPSYRDFWIQLTLFDLKIVFFKWLQKELHFYVEFDVFYKDRNLTYFDLYTAIFDLWWPWLTLRPNFLERLLDKLQFDVYFGYFIVYLKFDPWLTGKPEIRWRIQFLSSDSNFLAPIYPQDLANLA